ncbi:AAA family ATPase [uncultured Roseobacter sp.]|uniref:ExeA family protein n=1 Tax=uncultured Roseobacter sp. TaxID=114847 RepID=UPI002617D7A1|nr:AAA family ATPase [uncultured Roseobacter sp.]
MSMDLYTTHYGMRERPFTLLPDPDFLFWSPAHRRAYSVLEYGVLTRSPLTVITGAVGAGKTTLIQKLLSSLDADTVIGLISNAQGGRGDLLRWVLNALNIPHDARADYVDLHQTLQDFAISEYAEGRHVVLVIDEAQNLSIEALEELRLLTNINSNKDELMQLILVGQPELRHMIERPELRQFAQRVAAAYHLDPMDRATTIKYITHRLVHAGGSGEEFTRPALSRIYAETGGVPRLVNKLCDLALVYAAGAERERVGSPLISELIRDGIFFNPVKNPPLFLDRDYLVGNHQFPGKAAE